MNAAPASPWDDFDPSSAAPVAAPAQSPPSMAYDQQYGITRNPDGSIYGFPGGVSVKLTGTGADPSLPFVTTPDTNPDRIAAFLAKHPEDIAHQPKGSTQADSAASPWDDYAPPPSVGMDVAKGALSGVQQGISGVVGQVGDAASIAAAVPGKIDDAAVAMGGMTPQQAQADKSGLLDFMLKYPGQTLGRLFLPMASALPQQRAPTSADINAGRQQLTGPDYVPQTMPGQYARTLAQFLPAALTGEGAASRAVNVAVPALASETAGQYTKGTPMEGPARFFAGVAGGAMAPRVSAGASNIMAPRPSVPAGMTQAQGELARIGVNGLPDPAMLGARIRARQNPADAAIQQTAQDLPVPVPVSRGQMTGLPTDQLNENLALRGGRGVPAARVAQHFARDQQDALRANTAVIGSRLGNGHAYGIGHGGAIASDELNAARDAHKARVGAAYTKAREADHPAYLGPGDSRALVSRVRNSLADFDPLNIPRVAREVDNLHGTLLKTEAPAGVDVSKMMAGDVRGIFAARSRLTHLRASSDPVEAAAAKRAVEALDQAVEEAVTRDLFKGDPETVNLWRKAIGERREFGKLFEGNDLIQALTERQYRGGVSTLKVDPNDASNVILGRSNLGFVGRRNLYRDISRLKQVLGPESTGWSAIRAEVFQRLVQTGEGAVEGGNRQFSGVKFQKAWQEAKAKDHRLVDAMFSAEEQGVIDRFAAISARVTSPVKGGDNSSNTAVASRALRLFRRLPFVTLESVPLIDHFAEKIENAVNTRAITKATYGAEPRKQLPTKATPAAMARGAAAGGLLSLQRGR